MSHSAAGSRDLSMIVMSDFPDWYEVQKNMIEQDMAQRVEQAYATAGQPFGGVLTAGVTAAYFVEGAVLELGAMLFDLFRLGEGVGRATVGDHPILGVFSDAVRLLTVVAPVGKIVKMVAPSELISVIQVTGKSSLCTPMSTVNALQATEGLHFASVADLCKALKLKLPPQGGVGVHEIAQLLPKLGARVSKVTGGSVSSLEQLAARNVGDTFLVHLKWTTKAGGQTLEMNHTVAVQSFGGKLKWLDPSGAAGESLQHIESEIVATGGADGQLFDGIARASIVEYAQVYASKAFLVAGRRINVHASPLLAMLGLQVGMVEIRRKTAVEVFEGQGPRPGRRGDY